MPMPRLVSMKLSRREREEVAPSATPEAPTYPYGLRLSLNEDSLSKLGLTGLPAAGATVLVHAEATVVRRSESEDEREQRRDLDLQITDLALETEARSMEDRATAIYGKGS